MEKALRVLFWLFDNNLLKSNPDKSDKKITGKVENKPCENLICVKVLILSSKMKEC